MSEISIGVAIIADDCLDQLQRLLPQLEKFNQVVIGWNGSDVKVKNYLTKLSNKKNSPYEWFQFAWRATSRAGKLVTDDNGTQHVEVGDPYDINDWGFSYARNLTFSRIKTTHVLWLDTDDMIGYMKDGKDYIVSADQAYRAFKKIATEAPEDINVWFSTYIYSRDAYNNPNVVHARERLLKNPQDWKWVYPIHEVLAPSSEPKWAMIEDVKIIHYPPQKEYSSADRNLKMLGEWREQLIALNGPRHDLSRCVLYIGETYWALQQWKRAADALAEFIRSFPESLDIEKWQAWVFIAKCQLELNNFEAARAAALASIDIEPGLSDGYILLAQVKLVTEQDPQDILIVLEGAGRAEEPPVQIIQNPLDYTYTPYCITSHCKFLLGQYQAALEWAIKALQVVPGDNRAEKLRVQAAAKVRERDAVESAKALYQLYMDYDENEKASKLYEILPYVAQRDDEVVEQATVAQMRVRHLTDRDEYVKLYTMNTHWTPVPEEFIDSGDVPGESRMAYILGRLKKALPNGGRVLDVGCADGFHSMCFAKNGFEVVGVDLDKRCVDTANERARARGLSAIFVHGFFEEMNPDKMLDPFDVQFATKEHQTVNPAFKASTWRNHFDAVVCSEVIEHVQDPAFLMGALVDCAKENAPVIITTPDEAFDKGDTPSGGGMYEESEELTGHVRIFTQESFEALMKSDAEIDVVESHFVPYDFAYRDNQGWQVGEIRKRPHASGPIFRFYCGPVVSFCPDDLEDKSKNIAGSEVAVIHMAKHLAAMGCQVVVYSGVNGVWDGVFYRTVEHFSPEHYSDVFVSWRIPTIFENGRPNAKTTILWNHDIIYNITTDGKDNYIPQEWMGNVDINFVLSNFHKEFIEAVHPSMKGKSVVIRNGIDPSRYLDRNIEKVPHRYFYSSDWERGIDDLIRIWPQIKEAIPDAELHVAYSFELIKNLSKITNDKKRARELMELYAKMQIMDGVTFHDRLGQQELADLQLSCEAWLYPYQQNYPNGGFLETYCITAVEAQAARCIPITRLNGALEETTKNKIHWTKDSDIVDILVEDVPLWSESLLNSNQEWALKQTWESLAVDWLRLLEPKED